MTVPDTLLSGNHREIELWRRKQALGVTYVKRPDLLKNVKLTKEDDRLLQEFITELEAREDE
jgi:tRNA (guanine37-N1)-methyltransferase